MKNVNKSYFFIEFKKECLVKLPVFFSICLCFCSLPVCLVIAKTDLITYFYLFEFATRMSWCISSIEFGKIPNCGKMVIGKVSIFSYVWLNILKAFQSLFIVLLASGIMRSRYKDLKVRKKSKVILSWILIELTISEFFQITSIPV